MRKSGGNFGVVVLLVVLAVVLLLATRAWQSVMPTAAQIADPVASETVPDHGEPRAREAVRSGRLPDLHDARQQTAVHADRVQDALKQTE